MEKYFFFKPYNRFGGVRLSANRVFGNESINDMSIDERLLLVAEKYGGLHEKDKNGLLS